MYFFKYKDSGRIRDLHFDFSDFYQCCILLIRAVVKPQQGRHFILPFI